MAHNYVMLDMMELEQKHDSKQNSHDNDYPNRLQRKSKVKNKHKNDEILWSPFKFFDKMLLYSPFYIAHGRKKWVNFICLCFIVCFEIFYNYEECKYFAQVYGSTYEIDIIVARVVLSGLILIVNTVRLYIVVIAIPKISKILYNKYNNDRKSVINIRVESPKVSMSGSFTDDGTIVVERNKMINRMIAYGVIFLIIELCYESYSILNLYRSFDWRAFIRQIIYAYTCDTPSYLGILWFHVSVYQFKMNIATFKHSIATIAYNIDYDSYSDNRKSKQLNSVLDIIDEYLSLYNDIEHFCKSFRYWLLLRSVIVISTAWYIVSITLVIFRSITSNNGIDDDIKSILIYLMPYLVYISSCETAIALLIIQPCVETGNEFDSLSKDINKTIQKQLNHIVSTENNSINNEYNYEKYMVLNRLQRLTETNPLYIEIFGVFVNQKTIVKVVITFIVSKALTTVWTQVDFD